MMTAHHEKIAQQYREFDVVMTRHRDNYTREAGNRLRMETRDAANAYRERGGEGPALRAIVPETWSDYLQKLWRTVPVNAGTLIAEILDVTADRALLEAAAMAYLRGNANERGAGIAQTSRDAVSRSIEAGREAGELPGGIALRIAKDGRDASLWRGATIGSTEVHAAAYFGAWNAARQSRLSLDKVWRAPRIHGVTCDQHKSTHGQRRAVLEAFDVLNDYEPEEAADLMDYPGDGERGARAQNIINCRCAMEFVRR
jgi:hypothetical protein